MKREAKKIGVTVAVCTALLALSVVEAAKSLGRPAATEGIASVIELAPVVTSGLRSPVYVTHAGDGSGRLSVVEQPGRIRLIKSGALFASPFLDIADRVSFGGERGLLGLAFHPAYRQNGRYFVNYSRASDGATVVAEYRVSNDPDTSRRDEKIILLVDQPYGNHNGGMVAFGPDGFLYIGMGDGGAGGDPGNRGQDETNLLGKMLRIDVNGDGPYAIPSDNPFAVGGGRPEIFAQGFRNPWRFSFDRGSGRLWVADVGQNAWEEVDVVRRGGNYGWRVMEGAHCFSPPRGCRREGLVQPVAEYANRGPRCSITGGYVYRGKSIPALRGAYLFGDYCSGELFGLRNLDGLAKKGLIAPEVRLRTGLRISSFGEDEAGELYVVDHEGAIYGIIRARRSNAP